MPAPVAALRSKVSVYLHSAACAELDEAIGKIGAADGKFPQRLSDDFRSLNHQFFAPQ